MKRPTDPPAGYKRSAWSAAAIAKTDAERSRAMEEELKGMAEQPLPEFKETFKQRGGGNDDGGSGGDEKVALSGKEGNDAAAAAAAIGAPAVSAPVVSTSAASASDGEMGDQKGETGETSAEKIEEDGDTSEGENGAAAEPDDGCRL